MNDSFRLWIELAKPDFNVSFEIVLEIEGGYVDRPEDSGGPTNMGITLGTFSDWHGKQMSAEALKAMTKAQAKHIYRVRYWQPMLLDYIDEPLATVLFDQGVNRGVVRVTKELQTLVGVKADGVMGPQTLAALATKSKRRAAYLITTNAQHYYVDLVKAKSSQLIFLSGWINRTHRLLDIITSA